MCIMCDGMSVDEYVRDLRRIVNKHGWALQYVESALTDDGVVPAFCYTVGLTDFGRPELIMTGRAPHEAAGALNSLASSATAGGATLEAGLRYRAGEFEVLMVDVAHPEQWMGMNTRFFGLGNFTAVQAVWEDVAGNLPWEGDESSFIVQPVLGPPPGFGWR